jgi:hypothetical protein
MSLDQELQAYGRALPQLLEQEGRFVVIHKDEVLGVYNCRHDATLVGYERLGVDTPFLVRQISRNDESITTFLNVFPSS